MKRRPKPADAIKLTVVLDAATWKRLKDLATEQRRSLNDLLNEWIEKGLAPPAEDQSDGFRYPRPQRHSLSLTDGA